MSIEIKIEAGPGLEDDAILLRGSRDTAGAVESGRTSRPGIYLQAFISPLVY